jgi:hypothetical protein
MNTLRAALLALLLATSGLAGAQQLELGFSCSAPGDDGGDPVLYADHGRIKLDGDRIDTFYWESALYRRTHGFDCSIDEQDGLTLETWQDAGQPRWRVGLEDAVAARTRRGYDFSRGRSCTVRLERDGDLLHIRPSCPVLCGSRGNFSELAVNVKTGECRYEQQ